MEIGISTNYRNSPRNVIIVSILCILMGVLFIVIIANLNKNTASWPTTDALIRRIVETTSRDSISHDVYIDYSINGQEFKDVLLGAYESGMYEGQIIPIKYDPNDFTHIVYGKESFNNAFIIVGAFMCALGVVIPSGYFGYKFYKKKKENKNTNNPDNLLEK